MKRTLILIPVALIVVAVAALARRPVASASPALVNPPRLIVGAGRVEPLSEEIKVGAPLDGVLASVSVEEGQTVRRGQVLAALDNRDFEARVALASATVIEREAEVERLFNGSRPQQRRESDALVREAEAVLDNAQKERQRRLSLMSFGAISRVDFETADRELNVAQARLEAVRERSELVHDESRPEDIKRAHAEVERAKAQLAEARALLDKTVILAPISGVVLRKKLKAGESAATGDPIVTLGDCSILRVRVDVDENDVDRLRLGLRAWVSAAAFGDRKFPARVTRIGQILGRKNVRTDEPAEHLDSKILETLIELEPGVSIPIGMRVDAFIQP